MIASICEKLKNNQIGIIEHDTLPGIIAQMTKDNAIKINQIKKRHRDKGFIILIPSMDYLPELTIDIPKTTQTLMQSYWPGPLTIILKKHPAISSLITGSKTTIAIRYPKQPLLKQILSTLKTPLISTSANLSGETSLSDQLLNKIDFTYGNIEKNESNIASTIVDGTTSPVNILRQGTLKIPS